MCGLVGFINKNQNGFNKDQHDVFSTLLFLDQLRGNDSTGVFSISNTGDVNIAKQASDAVTYMADPAYKELLRQSFMNGSALIGHNRKATKGSITDENAHPFVVDDNIVLVHNGGIFGDHKKHAEVEVDSHAIAHLIHEKKDIAKALGEFHGAYALIWYDFAKATINLIRNHERPLWWMETQNAWIWSSEEAMLNFVITRYNIKCKVEPVELPEFCHQTFELRHRNWEALNNTVKVERPPTPVWPSYSGSGSGSGRTPIFGMADDFNDSEAYEEYMACGYRPPRMDAWPNHTPAATAHQPFRQPIDTKVIPLAGPTRTQQQQQQQPGGHQPQFKGPPGMEPPEFAGNTAAEKKLAIESNKIITYAEYTRDVLSTYLFDKMYMVMPFDYRCVNGRDSSDGYYLYSHPLDDRDVIFRHYYPSTIQENTMIQIAGTDYVFEQKVGVRAWKPMQGSDTSHVRDDTPGYVIIRSQFNRLVHRGTDKVIH
jgi:hypothetical protein